jgi:hypothetical protein
MLCIDISVYRRYLKSPEKSSTSYEDEEHRDTEGCPLMTALTPPRLVPRMHSKQLKSERIIGQCYKPTLERRSNASQSSSAAIPNGKVLAALT